MSRTELKPSVAFDLRPAQISLILRIVSKWGQLGMKKALATFGNSCSRIALFNRDLKGEKTNVLTTCSHVTYEEQILSFRSNAHFLERWQNVGGDKSKETAGLTFSRDYTIFCVIK